MELEGLGVAGQLGLEGPAGGGRAVGVGGGKAGVGWRCRGGCSWGWRGVIAQGGGGLGGWVAVTSPSKWSPLLVSLLTGYGGKE